MPGTPGMRPHEGKSDPLPHGGRHKRACSERHARAWAGADGPDALSPQSGSADSVSFNKRGGDKPRGRAPHNLRKGWRVGKRKPERSRDEGRHSCNSRQYRNAEDLAPLCVRTLELRSLRSHAGCVFAHAWLLLLQ